MRKTFALFAGLFWLAPVAWATDDPRPSVFHWAHQDAGLGGFSGIEVSDDGARFTAISDSGIWVRGTFSRSDAGTIDRIDLTAQGPLNDTDGTPATGFRADAEGLAIRDDGRIYVSFEGEARVWTYATLTGEAAWLPRHPDFRDMQVNSSLEALAIGPDGTLYTIPERSGDFDRPFSVYRYSGGKWSIPFSLPRSDEYLVSGADIGPDGRLYILERKVGLLGFQSRLRRFDLDGSGGVELWSGSHDNLEGVAIWRDARGRLVASMISDDNFLPIQRTLIVELVLPY
ncbi:esterase-like activity of phytase family protein [Marivivens marinus]|uniref:esterase-like activity of phytase family protein n=1 Tax=Marivivens marinus TaxID=3110173 RepID=UPI003B848FF5